MKYYIILINQKLYKEKAQYIIYKTMEMYKHSKIYVLRQKDNDNIVYVGSTVQPLYKRIAHHRKDAQTERAPLYQYMRETGIDNFYIELYANVECDCKEQLFRCEGDVIRKLRGEGIDLKNSRIAGRTKTEYIKENEQKHKNYQAKYREEHEEKHKDYMKEYRKNNKERIDENKKQIYICECGSKTQIHNYRHYKTKIHNDYLQLSEEEKINYKNKLIEEQKDKITCECGRTFKKHEKSRHLKTKIHQKYIQSLTQPSESQS